MENNSLSTNPANPPIFNVERLDWRPTADQGTILSISVSSNIILIATHNNSLIRWNQDTDDFEELHFSKIKAEESNRIHKIFLDPRGNHIIITFTNGNNYYINKKFNKFHQLSKLKGLIIESLAWNPINLILPNHLAEQSTRKILIGTNRGCIYELLIEDKEKHAKKLFEINEEDNSAGGSSNNLSNPSSPVLSLSSSNPISGLHIELFPSSAQSIINSINNPGNANNNNNITSEALANISSAVNNLVKLAESGQDPHEQSGNKYLILCTTATRQYQFVGGPTFDSLFSKYTQAPAAFLELPGNLNYSELRVFNAALSANNEESQLISYHNSNRAAWLTGAGLYLGELVFNPSSTTVLDNCRLLSYPIDSSNNQTQIPKSIMLTQFHYLLLLDNKLLVINQFSEQLIEICQLDSKSCGRLIGLVADSYNNSIWLYSEKYLFEITTHNEQNNLWKILLNQGKFDEALSFTQDKTQQSLIIQSQADYQYQIKQNYINAAKLYAKANIPFEQCAIKFINLDSSNDNQALKIYLLEYLTNSVNPNQLTQQTALATWITEIFANQINRLTTQANNNKKGNHKAANQPFSPFHSVNGEGEEKSVLSDDCSVDYSSLLSSELVEFHDFLSDYSDCLNVEVTINILASHGLISDLLYYAELIRDFNLIIHHYLNHNDYSAILQLFLQHNAPSKILELIYKYSNVLITHNSKLTVDLLCNLAQILDWNKLLPALISESNLNVPAHCIRYLELIIRQYNAKEQAIHNLLILNYAKLTDPNPLLRFIESFKAQCCYDLHYAISTCKQYQQHKALIALYCNVHLYELAVLLCLEQQDIALCKRVIQSAVKYVRNEGKAAEVNIHSLWMLLAEQLIASAGSDQVKLKASLQLLITNGADKDYSLSLADILPLFPDFLKLGSLKEEICLALDEYNSTIEGLKQAMNSASNSSSDLRNSVHSLKSRYTVVSTQQRCDSCAQPLLTHEFLLFPCTHAIHQHCASATYSNYFQVNPNIKQSLYNKARNELNNSNTNHQLASAEYSEQQVLSTLCSLECCLCGSMLLDSINTPFLNATDLRSAKEIKSWKI
jgi:hypothetical protein